MLAMGTLLYGCQHLEPQLTIGDPFANEPYRSQLRWLEPAPTDTIIQISESSPQNGGGSLWTRMRQGFFPCRPRPRVWRASMSSAAG
nr:hypothetical protein GCM10020185_37570 [Pseudomonas brassicacearum subsp. brassicacearum]